MNKTFKNNLLNISSMIIVSIIIGLVVGLYQLGVSFFKDLSYYLYSNRTNYIIILTIILMLFLSFLNGVILKYHKDIEGSGIPNIELSIRNDKNINYKKGIILIIINSFISTLAGFPLGSEGPSICIGGMLGSLKENILNKVNIKQDKNELFIYCASGFSAAFSSPLAGIVYAFEEYFHKFNFKSLIKTIFIICITVTFTFLINDHHLLHLSNFNVITFNESYVLIILLIINTLISFLFVKGIIFLRQLFKKYSNNKFVKYRHYFFFILIIILNFTLLNLMGSGINLMNNIFTYQSILILNGIFIFRFIITIFSGNAKVTGGLVIPMMTLGAISGQIISLFCINYYNLDPKYLDIIVLISSCMIFGLVTKVPFTSTILISSTYFYYTYDIYNTLFLFIISIVPILAGSLIISKYLKLECIYEEMIESDIKQNKTTS